MGGIGQELVFELIYPLELLIEKSLLFQLIILGGYHNPWRLNVRHRLNRLRLGNTFLHTLYRAPQALETLSRYEVGLYRQLEAALRQYWLVAGSRQRRRSDAPPELVQDVSSD